MTNADVCRVLLVEDELDIAVLLQRYLESSGLTVDVAHDGEAAWQQLGRAPPDVLVCDLMLPRLSGRELVARLRADPVMARVPVVVISASLHSQEAEQALASELGVQSAFRKPLALKELVRRVEGLAQEHRGGAARGRSVVGMATLQRRAVPAVASTPPVRRERTNSSSSLLAPLPRPPIERLGREKLTGMAAPGALAAVAVAVFEERAQCVLHVQDGTGRRSLYFHDGMLVRVATTHAGESLAAQLTRDGIIDAPKAAQVSDAMSAAGSRFGEAAVRLLGLPCSQVVAALERQSIHVASLALSSGEGTYELQRWDDNAILEGSVCLDPLVLIQQACLRHVPGDLILEELQEREELQVLCGDGFNERVLVFSRLRPRSVVPAALTDWPQLATALSRIKPAGLDGMRELLALILSQAVFVGEPDTMVLPVQRAGVLVGGGGDWSEPELPVTAAAIREMIAAEWVRTGGRNAYDILNVAMDATAAAVDAAVVEQQARFGPAALDDADLGPAKTYLQIIRARRDEAARLLTDPVARRAYNAALANALLRA